MPLFIAQEYLYTKNMKLCKKFKTFYTKAIFTFLLLYHYIGSNYFKIAPKKGLVQINNWFATIFGNAPSD